MYTVLLAEDFIKLLDLIDDDDIRQSYKHMFIWLEDLTYKDMLYFQTYFTIQFEEFVHIDVMFVVRDRIIYVYTNDSRFIESDGYTGIYVVNNATMTDALIINIDVDIVKGL